MILLLAITSIASGQEAKSVYKVVQIQKQQTFHLTGMLASRTYLPIQIPPNTVEWFIAFTSSKDAGSSSSIGLLGQLTKLVDPTGLSSAAFNALTTPAGSSRCDIVVTDLENRRKFMNGEDRYGRYDEISRKNITHGVIKVDGRKYQGNLEILVFNPAYTSSINVTIEVTAVVDGKQMDRMAWPKETKDKVFDAYYLVFLKDGMEPKVAKEVANCIVESTARQKKPEEMNRLSKSERDAFSMKIMTACLQEMQGGAKTAQQEKAISYGNLGWKAYENGDVDKCMEYSKKALELDPNMGWVQANLGLCYLIKGDVSMATDYYVGAISSNRKDKLGAKKHFQEQIKDIDNAVEKYPGLQGYKDIRDLLESEVKR